MTFDPDAASTDDNLFGLPATREESRVIVLPVPFEATVSGGSGSEHGPAAVALASHQIDLLDRRFGPIYEAGIFMDPIASEIEALSAQLRALARPIIEKGGADDRDAQVIARIDDGCEALCEHIRSWSESVLKQGKVPALLGGEHSIPLGSIIACAEHAGEIGLLQIDAHMDLRDAYLGFRHSHASIMRNVLERCEGVTKLVQVGIRDFGQYELEYAEAQGDRVSVHFADDLYDERQTGVSWKAQCERIVESLPGKVYVSFDIDGLDAPLCPHTGTPVPGGLSFLDASLLIQTLRDSGREVVGFDLVEVSPGAQDEPMDLDALVGARVLYRLCGLVR